jgi:sRNA-binding carbon storage regulator CsrA
MAGCRLGIQAPSHVDVERHGRHQGDAKDQEEAAEPLGIA